MRNVPKRKSTHNELVAGFDLSLTASGVVILDLNGKVVARKVIKVKTFGAERLNDIQNIIRSTIADYNISLVCIEGYAFGSKNNREVMGELGGVIRLLLYRKSINYLTPTPNAVKKFATGHGGGENGSKDQVTMHVYKQWGFEAKDNNEADAYVLARIALAIQTRDKNLLKYQDEVVKAVLDPPKKKKKKKGDE